MKGEEPHVSSNDMKTHNLLDLARAAMLQRGLEPSFSEGVIRELQSINECAVETNDIIPDLTHLPWCSIDNDNSMDLDQITVSQALPSDRVRILVGVADVDAIVKIGSEIDKHARKNTTSVYTGVKIFPMLPEKLSTDLTSLSEGEIRIAVIIDMVIKPNGEIEDSSVYRARVLNHAKLTYNDVSNWLEGKGPLPVAALKVVGMDEQLRVQDRVAQKMRSLRHQHGALELETIEPRAVVSDGRVIDLKQEKRGRARDVIEDFMIAANGVTARFLTQAGYPTLRRVVRSPKRWERIVQVALELGDQLPSDPDSVALAQFLSRRRAADPLRFPDLSLTIVKLLGRGEYTLEIPGQPAPGHFGLAVQDYSHSTAPNRRFADLITHRLLKSSIRKTTIPYDNDELRFLASHCTLQQDAADKVERQVRKSAAALLLSSRIGEYFEGIVTGASEKGIWARVFNPPVEGKVARGEQVLDVGVKVRLQLIGVNVERGYIDFVQAKH